MRSYKSRFGQPEVSGAPGSKRRGDLLARGDMIASGLAAAATLLAAGALFFGPPRLSNPPAFIWIAPLAAAVFFVAMVAMWLERERHGVARVLCAIGAIALGVGGLALAGAVPPMRLLLFYWLPALCGMGAAVALTRAKRQVKEAKAPASRSPPRKR